MLNWTCYYIKQQFNYVVRGDDGVQFYSSTTLLWETWWPWRPPPLLSEIMPKHDEDGGDIGEKNIGGQLGLVRVDLTKKHTFCQHVLWSAAYRIIVNKIENE